MSRSQARVSLALLALVLVAAPGFADVYYVTLANGSVIETAFQPQQASWDPSLTLLLTEVGNWVGFPSNEIESIRSEDPTEGYGVKISDNAIALGWSPNDLPEATAQDPQQALNERILALTNRQLELAEQQQNYSVQQFVGTDQTQGIPASFGGYTGGFTGGGSGFGSTPLPPAGAPVTTGEGAAPPQ